MWIRLIINKFEIEVEAGHKYLLNSEYWTIFFE